MRRLMASLTAIISQLDRYNLVLTFYYAFFVVFGPTSGLIIKVVSAKYSLPRTMVLFSTTSTANAAAINFSGLLACRVMLGIFEAGFLTS